MLVDWKTKYEDLKRAVAEYNMALGQWSQFKITMKGAKERDMQPHQIESMNMLRDSLIISTNVLQQLMDENPEELAFAQDAAALRALDTYRCDICGDNHTKGLMCPKKFGN